MKQQYKYQAMCDICGWKSKWYNSGTEVAKAVKQHNNDNPHRDYDDVSLFDEKETR